MKAKKYKDTNEMYQKTYTPSEKDFKATFTPAQKEQDNELKDFGFRLWHNLSESFVEIRGGFLTANAKDEIVFEKSLIVPIDDENVEIELWSGFYDCKGTKIYEGDIVKYRYRSDTTPLVVVFERSTFYIVDTSIKKNLQVDCGTRLQGIYDNRSNGHKDKKLECLKVVGNIHEMRNF